MSSASYLDPNKHVLLDASDLECSVGRARLFRHLSIHLTEGDMVEIVGPNGSGKSTLLKMLAGLRYVAQGNTKVSDFTRREYLGHDLGLNPLLTSIENLRWLAAIHSISVNHATVIEVLKRVGIGALAYKPIGELSAGQRKRCAFARLLLANANVWLLDEPYSSLDLDGRELVDTLLAEHLDHGGGAIVATHQRLTVPPSVSISLRS